MSVKKIFKDTYCLTDKGPAGTVKFFLLVGSERALLIDTGYGTIDLPSVIREITDKPITVALTHGHLDHAGGAYLFDDVYMHSADAEVYKKHSSEKFLKENYAKARKHSLKKHEISAETLISAEKKLPKPLEGISEFDLGNRKIRWCHIPGHTHGCCAFIDTTNKIAFTGDMLSVCIWLQLPESLSLDAYKTSILQLKQGLAKVDVQYIYPAHWFRVKGAKLIDKFCNLVEAVKNNKASRRVVNNPADGGALSGTLYGKGGVYLVKKD